MLQNTDISFILKLSNVSADHNVMNLTKILSTIKIEKPQITAAI